jgi:glycosyltransferase involved in cell wall biosynthesis
MKGSNKNILFIGHDANRAGAQLFLLDVIKSLKSDGYGIQLLLLEKWGPLLDSFENICEVLEYPKFPIPKFKIIRNNPQRSIEAFFANNYSKVDLIYANTIASSTITSVAKEILKVPLVSHIHELQFSLGLYSKKSDTVKMMNDSDKVIACSQAVGDNLIEQNDSLEDKVTIIHSFVNNDKVLDIVKNSNKDLIKIEFNLPPNAFLAGACGNSEWRKGLDIFISLVNVTKNSSNSHPIHFVWIGLKAEGEFYNQIMYDADKMGIKHLITFLEPTPKAVEIINALDVFVVSSREDPFPLVMLEAALCKKPILGFRNTGGCSEFVKNEAGILSEYLDINGMSKNLTLLASDENLRLNLGEAGQKSILQNYSFEHSIKKIKSVVSELI